MAISLLSAFVPNLSFQFLARILSFVLNIFLIRKVDLSLLGVVNVSLTLYYTTVIFLVREPFRRTFLSSSVPLSSIIDHYWLCPALYPVVAVLLWPLWSFSSWPSEAVSPGWALFAFGFSAWLESLADPLVVICQRYSMNVEFALLQSIQIISQRLFIVAFIVASPFSHFWIFCYAQVFASLVYLVVATYLTRHRLYEDGLLSVDSVFPRFRLNFAKKELKTFSSFVWHSVSKHLATEGANFVLTFAANMPHESQAIYDAIDKLGSLVVRIVLTPLDQAAEVYFSHYLKRGERAEKQDPVNIRSATNCLVGLMHLALLAGLIACTFAIPFSPLAVLLYGGQKFVDNSAASILSFYCVYVVIIAVNGITECFAMSTMDNAQTVQHGTFLSVASITQFAISASTSRFIGAYGIILANSLIMLLRIAYNWRRIKQYLEGRVSFTATLPSLTIFLLLIFALGSSSLSYVIFGRESGIVHNAAHVAVGGALFLFVANYIYHNDEAILMFITEYAHARRD